jgi:ribonuclease P protein component
VARPEAKASPVLAGFSVPKKKIRKSVGRHRIRRQMVEAWRLNKHLVYPIVPPGKQLHLFFIFTDIAMPEYEVVQNGVLKCIDKLLAVLNPPITQTKEP